MLEIYPGEKLPKLKLVPDIEESANRIVDTYLQGDENIPEIADKVYALEMIIAIKSGIVQRQANYRRKNKSSNENSGVSLWVILEVLKFWNSHEILKKIFGSLTKKIMTGKNHVQCVQALRMLVEEMLCTLLVNGSADLHSKLLQVFQIKNNENRTAILWVNV